MPLAQVRLVSLRWADVLIGETFFMEHDLDDHPQPFSPLALKMHAWVKESPKSAILKFFVDCVTGLDAARDETKKLGPEARLAIHPKWGQSPEMVFVARNSQSAIAVFGSANNTK